jgi:predicted dehydrogenase
MERSGELGRRELLRRGAVGLGVLAGVAAGAPLGANEKMGLALIGSGGRGRTLLGHFQKQPGLEFRAICDVYDPNLKAGVAAASPTASPHLDYHEVLARKDIDAVVIATPDHWHSRMVIDAVEAGKDVYVEKPLCHKVEEGFQVVEAVERTRRVVQVGTQRRSYPLFQEGKQAKESGGLGPVRLVTAWWLNQQTGLGQGPLQGKLDWERWLGSAPRRPLDELRFRNWYYFWDYSGGLMVGQAAHMIDAIHWFMGSTFPLAVTTSAGRPHLEGAEVPETTSMALEYPEDYLAVFTVGYSAMRYPTPRDQMLQFHGLKARFDIGRESFALHPETMDRDAPPTVHREAYGTFPSATDSHVANFLDCCRTRKRPNAPVEAGNSTNVALCMAMESLRTGRRVRFDAERRAMVS